jgi:hypothetical protein
MFLNDESLFQLTGDISIQLKCASRGPPDHVALRWLKSGPRLGGMKFPSISATLLQIKSLEPNSYRSEISIAYKKARFRDLKKVLSSIGLTVIEADRRKLGPFSLSDIGKGHIAELSPRIVEKSLDKAIPNWRQLMLTTSSPDIVQSVAETSDRSKNNDDKLLSRNKMLEDEESSK